MAKSIIIIGGGPGGYVAAIRAAQLRAEVTLIEKDTLGGTCVNRGCIPTKTLLKSADLLAQIRSAEIFGISAKEVTFNYSVLTERKKMVVKQLVAGISSLMRKNRVRIVKGIGTLVNSNTVGILGQNSQLRADSIIIATGSKPSTISIKGAKQDWVITSDEALTMDELPKSVIIIGGGVIGLEFAQIMHAMGCEVTVIEMMPQILPNEDVEITSILRSVLEEKGIDIITEAMVDSIKDAGQRGKAVLFTTRNKDGRQEKTAEKVLLAVGRSPNTEDLQIERLGIAVDNERIVADQRMETNVPGIYAIGDVVGGLMLAHVAMEEGKCAAENSLGVDRKINYNAAPRCLYTSPEIAAIGLTEEQAKKEHINIRVGRFPFIANGKALILGETIGMVKIVASAEHGEILGVHILGPQATEVIAEAALAMRMEATIEEFASTIHAHPSISEAVGEAALGVLERAINI